MFTARTATEVLSGYQDLTFICILIQHKVRIRVARLVITPVAEKIIAEALACGRFQEAGRDDLVCVYIFQRKRYTGGCYYREFFFHFVLLIFQFVILLH